MTYNTHGTCSRQIIIEIEDDTVTGITFVGGCSGNTQGVAALATGMKINEVIERLRGLKCGFKPTSCPDQLAQALEQYVAQKS
ncbi:MAG: TIGR03905 family TSCPD domain-containing protein [Clostridia bacterium]|nr:TIGR03905 family TSCPD domain-containing protein [Clostridia bacterium]